MTTGEVGDTSWHGAAHVSVVKGDGVVSLDAIGFGSMTAVIAGGQAALDRIAGHLETAAVDVTLADADLLAPIE